MVNRAPPSSGPARTQHFKAQQKEQALADAREKEAQKRKETIAANTKRVAAHLLSGLSSQLDRYGASAEGGPGPGAELTAGWTVEFNLPRVSGDPEGVQRGQRINSKDRSVVYVTPDGRRFSSREAIAKHFELQAPEEEPKGPTDKNGKPKKPKPAPPPYEPPPVQTESGKLAFEVERVLDVRAIPMYVCVCGSACSGGSVAVGAGISSPSQAKPEPEPDAASASVVAAHPDPDPDPDPTPSPTQAGAAAQARRARVPRALGRLRPGRGLVGTREGLYGPHAGAPYLLWLYSLWPYSP